MPDDPTIDDSRDDSTIEPYVDDSGRAWPVAMRGESRYPDYAALAGEVPFDKPKPDYTSVERQAELFAYVQQAGHPKNMEQSQSTLGDRYGVTQQQISKDMDRIREYVATHDTSRAKAVVGFLNEKTVTKFIEAADRMEDAGRLDEAAEKYADALSIHMDYVEYLMEAGDMESASEEIEVSGDPGAAYMNMLRKLNEDE